MSFIKKKDSARNTVGDKMTHDEIVNYIFNDKAVDSIERVDVALRKALIEREITKKEYIAMERMRLAIYDLREDLSDRAWHEFREVLNNI